MKAFSVASCVVAAVAAAAAVPTTVAGRAAAPSVKLNNGVEMPVVSIGTWQYNATVAHDAVLSAFEAGFTHVDTAHDYGNQDGVGRALAESSLSRDEVFVTTKVPGCGLQGVSLLKCHDDTLKVHRENLQLLNLTHSDLLLIHFPPIDSCSLGCKAIQEQWGAMEYILENNLSRAIGVSNYCPSCFECLFHTAKVTPAVNQVMYHVGMGTNAMDLRSYCAEKQIVLQAYSPLGDGSTELINGPVVTPIANAHNKSGAQVALKWLIQSGIPLSTKATNPKYLAEDIDLFSWTLTDEEMGTLNTTTKPPGSPSFLCTK